MTDTARTVLVINAGSSSLKYQLIDISDETTLAAGLVEKIGEPGSVLTHRHGSEEQRWHGACANHTEAFRWALSAFAEMGPPLADHPLRAIGHRVVHGGTRFSAPALVTGELIAAVTELIPLAPLHNPANLDGIAAALDLFPQVPQVAVFDTAFHQSLPPHAYTYAIPHRWREELGVRRYGFHGTSHAYVARSAARLLGRSPEDVNVIVAHLGNGASMTAVRAGKSVDTSMGLTPLEGLVMGTRPGDLDPGLAGYLSRLGMSAADYDEALNKDSGLKGLSGRNDYRDIHAGIAAGDPDAELAYQVAVYRVRKYLGAYAFALGRVDAVAFTAGAGENDAALRAAICEGLAGFGIVVDPELNISPSRRARRISPPDAGVAVLVVPTNEELEIALQAAALAG